MERDEQLETVRDEMAINLDARVASQGLRATYRKGFEDGACFERHRCQAKMNDKIQVIILQKAIIKKLREGQRV